MRDIFFSQIPDPANLREQESFTVQVTEDGQITGDLCRNTTDLLEYLKEQGIDHEALIDFCG
jgi:hypothetical protein